MLELFGKRQQALLKLLLKHKDGLSIDELASHLDVTRNAVRQHLAALETGGYLQRGEERRTAGRPEQRYILTERGSELFPKQYSWFSGLLLEAIRQERGSEGLSRWLRDIAGMISKGFLPRVEGKDPVSRLEETRAIMNELAFEVTNSETGEEAGSQTIEATNCIYHALAKKFPEVCEFDLELISRLSGISPEHQECMLRGGHVCRFRLETSKND